MSNQTFSRRDFIRFSMAFALSTLSGCGNNSYSPTLRATRETLPKKLLSSLPSPWQFKKLNSNSNKNPYLPTLNEKTDLLVISDGWLSSLSSQDYLPIDKQKIPFPLDNRCNSYLTELGNGFSPYVLPIGFSPWVMLLRRDKNLRKSDSIGWDLLLDSSLKGKIVLPESPRLIMSLAERMRNNDALRILRSQVLTYDDKNGINWLLNGSARVVILPLQRCLSKLKHDPRLSIVFPNEGAPLNWTLLLRPKSTKEQIPYQLLEKAWSMPLMGKLMSDGWIPPIARLKLKDALKNIPEKYHSILLPPQEIWENCWSFGSLNVSKKRELEQRWIDSSP